MTRAQSQCEAILSHLQTGASISPIEALNMFGCFRLGARIYDLKADGYDIVTEWGTDGEKRWAVYSLAPKTLASNVHERKKDMSRAGYTDDGDDQWQHIMWRGAVASAIRGKRGQAFLYEALTALDALPTKRLIANDLIVTDSDDGLSENANVCLLGAVGLKRRIDMRAIDPEDAAVVARTFDISDALAREIMWTNDEGTWGKETPEQRFVRVRKWIVSRIGQWRVMVDGDLAVAADDANRA